MNQYQFIDCTEKYHSVMQFDKNKNVFVHRWYPFVEGYSKEFIETILSEINFTPRCALEPFSGSGTTSVELQNHNIKCWSFEVSPFMHLLAKAKLERNYSVEEYVQNVSSVSKILENAPLNIRNHEVIPFGDSVVPPGIRGKWNFHDEPFDGILDVRYAIKHIPDKRYRDLFYIALASILMYSSNMFRNGKCLSYKKGWRDRIISRDEIHKMFLSKLNGIFLDDLEKISLEKPEVINSKLCIYDDVRDGITIVPDNSVDLIITSPPYLNSRDYTDIYMLELKLLELVNSYDELKNLRKRTLRSHVQVSYDKLKPINNERLIDCIEKMRKQQVSSQIWNTDILNMICGYFEDMVTLFTSFRKKMMSGGVIYFNVANSAYFGVEVPVDYIIADIAEEAGFHVREIRKARNIKTSPQQSDKIDKLRESVIVIDS